MSLETELQAAVTRAENASQILHRIIHGNISQTVLTESGEVKTLARTLYEADLLLQQNMQALTELQSQASQSALNAKEAEESAEQWAHQAENASRQTFVSDTASNTSIETERYEGDNKIRLRVQGEDKAVLSQSGLILTDGEDEEAEASLHIKETEKAHLLLESPLSQLSLSDGENKISVSFNGADFSIASDQNNILTHDITTALTSIHQKQSFEEDVFLQKSLNLKQGEDSFSLKKDADGLSFSLNEQEHLKLYNEGYISLGASSSKYLLSCGDFEDEELPDDYSAIFSHKLSVSQNNKSFEISQETLGTLQTYDYAEDTPLDLSLNPNGGDVYVGSKDEGASLKARFKVGIEDLEAPDAFGYLSVEEGNLSYTSPNGKQVGLSTRAAYAVGVPETAMNSQSLVIKGSDGKLYTRGREQLCGRGGVTEGSHHMRFAPVWLPDDFGPVSYVWCGFDYVICASETQNKIATFGIPNEGVLGTGNTSYFQGVHVIELPAKAVQCVTNEMSCQSGERGFIVRLENNDCYTYGWNGENCLDDSATQTNNSMLTGYKLAHKYRYIAGYTGAYGMVFGVDDNDYKTYVWGYVFRGAAGIGHDGSIPYNTLIGTRRPVSVLPSTEENHIVKIVANYQVSGDSHYANACFLTKSGDLYGCGYNEIGRYYLPFSENNNTHDQSIPKFITSDVVDFSVKLWLGGWLKKTNGLIQTWGRNLDDWRGNGKFDDTRSSLENWNESFFVGKDTKVSWAASYIYDGGGACALFALDKGSGKLYSSGSYTYNANGQCDNLNARTNGVTEVNTGGLPIKDFSFKGCGTSRHESSAPVLIMENGQIWTTGYNHYYMVSPDHASNDNIMHWVPNSL